MGCAGCPASLWALNARLIQELGEERRHSARLSAELAEAKQRLTELGAAAAPDAAVAARDQPPSLAEAIGPGEAERDIQ